MDQITQPLQLSPEALETEKGVITGEIHQSEADQKQIVQRVTNNILFSETNPLNYPILGTKNSLNLLTLQDLRAHHETIFTPEGLGINVFTEATLQLRTLF